MDNVLTTHHQAKTEDGQMVVTKVDAYLLLNNPENSHDRVILKRGQVVDFNGIQVPHPAWLDKVLKTVNPKVLAEIGFKEHVQKLNTPLASAVTVAEEPAEEPLDDPEGEQPPDPRDMLPGETKKAWKARLAAMDAAKEE